MNKINKKIFQLFFIGCIILLFNFNLYSQILESIDDESSEKPTLVKPDKKKKIAKENKNLTIQIPPTSKEDLRTLPLSFIMGAGYSFFMNPSEDVIYENGHGFLLQFDVHRLYEIIRLKPLQKKWGKRVFLGASFSYHSFTSKDERFKNSSMTIPGIYIGYNLYTFPLYKPWKIIYFPLLKIGYEHYISSHEFLTPGVSEDVWTSYSTYRPIIHLILENAFLIQENYYVSLSVDYKMIFENQMRHAFAFNFSLGYNL